MTEVIKVLIGLGVMALATAFFYGVGLFMERRISQDYSAGQAITIGAVASTVAFFGVVTVIAMAHAIGEALWK